MKRTFFGDFFACMFMYMMLIFVGIILPTRVFAAPPQIPTSGCFVLDEYFDVSSDAKDAVCHEGTGNLGFSLYFDYGTVSGTGICSSVGSLDGPGSIGNPSVGTGGNCWCYLTGYKDGKNISLTGSSTFAVFIEDLVSSQGCNDMCGCLCSDVLAGTPEMRERLYSAKGENEFCVGMGMCDTLLDIDSNFCSYNVSSGGATTGMDWTMGLTGGKSVTGTSLCSTTSGTSAGNSGTPDESGGGSECWCRLTGYNDGTNQYNATNSTWFYYGDEWGNNADCTDSCPALCAKTLFPDYLCNMAGGEFCAVASASYNVTYSCGTHGTGSPTDSNSPYADGSTITTLAGNVCTADTGYDFNGWLCDNNVGTVSAGGTFTMPAADVSCTAQWAENRTTVSYACGTGATGSAPISGTATYGSNFIFAANNSCAKTGYRFDGWNCNGLTGVQAPNANLPSGYTQLNYIQSTGTQWIDTGFKFTGSTVRYDFVYNVPTAMNGKSLFGASDNNANWSGVEYFYGSGANSSNYSLTYIGSSGSLNQKANTPGTTYSYSLFIDRDNRTYQLQKAGSSYSGSFSGTVTNSVNIGIFAQNMGTSVTQYSSYKNYGFKITQDGTLVHNFVPAKNSSNVLGMYDTVGGTFKTNSGSGTFVAGNPEWTYTGSTLSCTANWAQVDYTVSFEKGDEGGLTVTGATSSLTGKHYGDTITLPASGFNAPTGYHFNGWSCNNGIGNKAVGATFAMPASNVICTAQWEQDNYTVSFAAGSAGGNTPTGTTASFTNKHTGDTITLPASGFNAPTGYHFNGWLCDNDIGNKAVGATFTMPAANVICTAQWTANQTTVSYACGTGATGSAPAANTATYGSNFIFANNNSCAKTGYNFAGWTCTGLTGTQTAGGAGVTWNYTGAHGGTLACTAEWNAKTAAITYDCNGGTIKSGQSGNMSATFTYGQSYSLTNASTLCERTGYSLTTSGTNIVAGGWICENTSTRPSNYISSASGTWNLVYNPYVCTAQWTQDLYKIKYRCPNEMISMSTAPTWTYGQSAPISDFVCGGSNPGYNFTGWYCDGGNTLLNYGNSIQMYHDVTCVSQWSPITYTITYNAATIEQGIRTCTGSTPSTTATMGQSATLATNNFVCSGLNFAGWRCQDANQTIDVVYGSGQTVNPWPHPANLTCTAQWSASTTQYTLSYSCGNGVSGNPPASESYLYGQSYNLKDYPGGCVGANGMNFNGWSCNNGLTAPSGAYNVEANSVCTAQWVAQDVDLKWFGENGTQLSGTDSYDCTYGNTIALIPTAPEKPGYHFKRWNVMQSPLANLDVNIMPTSVVANNVSNGNNVCAYSNGAGIPNTSVACNNAMASDLNSYEWKNVFSYGTVYGLARCSSTPYIGHYTGNPSETEGRWCWCRAIGYKPTNGLLQSIPVSAWVSPVNVDNYSTTAECWANCASYCAGKIAGYPDLRTYLYEQ